MNTKANIGMESGGKGVEQTAPAQEMDEGELRVFIENIYSDLATSMQSWQTDETIVLYDAERNKIYIRVESFIRDEDDYGREPPRYIDTFAWITIEIRKSSAEEMERIEEMVKEYW
jgi:hypothetical protein